MAYRRRQHVADGVYPEVDHPPPRQGGGESNRISILFSENNIRNPEDPEVKRGLRDIARWAADHRCYVVVGGSGDGEFAQRRGPGLGPERKA